MRGGALSGPPAPVNAQLFTTRFHSSETCGSTVRHDGGPLMGRLTTHVLDTANGIPAVGVTVELHVLDGPKRALVQTVRTNEDGRAPAPLLQGAAFRPGTYELAFDVGQYFKRRGTPTADPPFLSVVTLRFTIADPDGHYHVPLLASPWSYTTYRGS